MSKRIHEYYNNNRYIYIYTNVNSMVIDIRYLLSK